MTREEFLQEGQLFKEHFGSRKGECQEIDFTLQCIEFIEQAPAPLQKWTPEMGTPPDGLYLLGIWFKLTSPWVLIESERREGDQVHWYDGGKVYEDGRLVYESCSLADIWKHHFVLHGPIPAPEGGCER